MTSARRTVSEIVGWLAREIYAGVFPPDSRLPAERRLAAQLGVHRSTVALAYDELAARGLVDRRQGSGTYVHGDLWGLTPDWTRYLGSGGFRPSEALVQRVREARRQPFVIDLTQADLGPDFWPALTMAADALGPLDWGYGHPFGLLRLRTAIAERFTDAYGRPWDPDAVLVTHGAQQALYLVARALLRPGDAVAMEQPSFYYSLTLFQSIGVRLIPVPMDDAGIVPDALDAAIRQHRPAMVWLNPTFHNPTTTTLPEARRREVLAICRRWNLPVVEDDAYGALSLDRNPPLPLKVLDDTQRVIYVGTLSKMGAPGLRVGWVLAPRPILERLADVRSQLDGGPDALTQGAAAALLETTAWSRQRARVREGLYARRAWLQSVAGELAGRGLRVTVPSGGLFAWIRWAAARPDRVRLEAAIAQGVVYVPGRVYGAPDGFGRINYVTPAPEALRRGLGILAEL